MVFYFRVEVPTEESEASEKLTDFCVSDPMKFFSGDFLIRK